MFAAELFSYLKAPYFLETTPSTIKDRATEIAYGYMVAIGLTILSVPLILLIDNYIVQYFYHYSVYGQLREHNKIMKTNLGKYAVLMIVVIAPLIEELVFRLPLKLKGTGVGVCLGIITYRLIAPHFFEFDVEGWRNYLALGAGFGVFLFCALILPSHVFEKIRGKYFAHLFYFSAIAFALVHVSNFSPVNGRVLLFYPFYTLPQFFMGLCIGYIRMKHGFVSGWALHGLINLPFALFY